VPSGSTCTDVLPMMCFRRGKVDSCVVMVFAFLLLKILVLGCR
jgi:hypothetical protein